MVSHPVSGVHRRAERNPGTAPCHGSKMCIRDRDNTAAIGDGAYHDGKGTSIAITGGIVTASGQYGIGRGNTSEPYPSAYRGKFSMTGNAVIFTKGITDTSEQDQWNGIVFFSTSGQVYGDSVTVDTDFTIPEGYTLTIPDDGTLCVGDGAVSYTHLSSLQRCNGIFLLLPTFCPRVRFVLKGQKETAGDCLPGTQLIDEPEIILLKGTASRIRLL